MSNATLLNQAYKDSNEAPWEEPNTPQELVDLVEQKVIKPCKVLDIGCGTGNYSIYLAQNGFEVAGIDISENAIFKAKDKAAKLGLNIKFITSDALEISSLQDKYDFIIEWGLLHFIPTEFRKKYIKDVADKLVSGGKYMVLTFNDQSPEWGGGKFRTGLTGVPLFYSSMEELYELYQPYFKIIESRIRPTYFKNSDNKHLENYFLLVRN